MFSPLSSTAMRLLRMSSKIAKKVATISDRLRDAPIKSSIGMRLPPQRRLSTNTTREETDTIFLDTMPENASAGGGTFRFPRPAARR